jgi:hypothetical protein
LVVVEVVNPQDQVQLHWDILLLAEDMVLDLQLLLEVTVHLVVVGRDQDLHQVLLGVLAHQDKVIMEDRVVKLLQLLQLMQVAVEAVLVQ